jgi:hypothetical protein
MMTYWSLDIESMAENLGERITCILDQVDCS